MGRGGLTVVDEVEVVPVLMGVMSMGEQEATAVRSMKGSACISALLSIWRTIRKYKVIYHLNSKMGAFETNPSPSYH